MSIESQAMFHQARRATRRARTRTTVNRAWTRWIGPNPNPRSYRAPYVKDRHGEEKMEDVRAGST